jgi:hypothetical protein
MALQEATAFLRQDDGVFAGTSVTQVRRLKSQFP